jgi:geranylgeranyl pyrophosphate synthase
MVALSLASRKPQAKADASVDGVKDIEHALVAELERVEKMRKASDGIRKHNDTLKKELDKAEDELKDLVGKARETLRALDGAADNEDAEREEPIGFTGPSSTTAA